MPLKPSLIALAFLLGTSACASAPPNQAGRSELAAETAGTPLSPAALATAIRQPDGLRTTYATPLDALKAGDTAGYLTLLAAQSEDARGDDRFLNAYLAIDRAAAGDMA